MISVLSSNSLLLHLFCFGQAKVLLRFSSPLFYFLLCQENIRILGRPLSKNQNVHLKLPQSNVRFIGRLFFFTHINQFCFGGVLTNEAKQRAVLLLFFNFLPSKENIKIACAPLLKPIIQNVTHKASAHKDFWDLKKVC